MKAVNEEAKYRNVPMPLSSNSMVNTRVGVSP